MSFLDIYIQAMLNGFTHVCASMYVAIVIRYEDAKNLEEEAGRKE